MFNSDTRKSSVLTMMEEYSPSLPKGFPKELLPAELCEKPLLALIECTNLFPGGQSCENRYFEFSQCRRYRDSAIFKAIMDWEKSNFANYPEDFRQKYLLGLKARVAALKRDKDKIPVSQVNENKIWRFNADITQLNWRYRYLSGWGSQPPGQTEGNATGAKSGVDKQKS